LAGERRRLGERVVIAQSLEFARCWLSRAATGSGSMLLFRALPGPGSPGMILGLGTATNPDPGLAEVADFRLALA